MNGNGSPRTTVQLNDGNIMPLLGIGTWKNHDTEVFQGAVEAAIAAGYRHIDTAFSYGTEVEVGRALRAKIQQGIITRKDMFVVSKLWCTHHAPKDVALCLEKSLNDLQMDYLDLYLIHFPMGLQRVNDEIFPTRDGKFLTTDVDYVDVWKEMEVLQASGKVRSIGVSNFNIHQLERLLSVANKPPAVLQVEHHPYLDQSDLIQFCKSWNISLTACCPLGSPKRPQEYHRGVTDPEMLLDDPVVKDVAKKHRRSPAQVVLRYSVQQGIAVIPKSLKSNEILENSKIFEFSLDEADMAALRGLHRGWRACVIDGLKSHPHYPFK